MLAGVANIMSIAWSGLKHALWALLAAFVTYSFIQHILSYEPSADWWFRSSYLSLGLLLSVHLMRDVSDWARFMYLNRTAFWLTQRGAHDRALGRYSACSRIYPADATSHFNVGVALSNLGQYSEAVDAFSRSLELDPLMHNAYRGRATAFLGLGDSDAASRDAAVATNQAVVH